MSCRHEEDLTAWVDGELPPLQARALETHVAGCDSCTATVALLRKTVALLPTLPALEPSAALRRKVLAQLDEPESRLRAWLSSLLAPKVLAPALGVAAAAAVTWVALDRRATERLTFEPEQLAVAQNMEVLEDFEVLGLESADDLEVVARLDELDGAEVTP